MIQKKLACNATNSAAIDCHGNLLVWGSGKFGLLGKGFQEHNFSHPHLLDLHRVQQFALTSELHQTRLVVEDISMGQYHMAAVVSEGDHKEDFQSLEFAKEIFGAIKKHVRKQQMFESSMFKNERRQIELLLAERFKEDRKTWPFIKSERFNRFLVEDVKLQWTKDLGYVCDALCSQLATGADKTMINAKELRDQLVGVRSNLGMVFTWGLNDARLGYGPVDATQKYMIPQVVNFESSEHPVVIKKVACGSTFTIALSNKGDFFCWGIGMSGALGLSEGSDCQESFKPRLLKFPGNVEIKAIAAGSQHCLALSVSGKVFSWGSGQGGRLGQGDQAGRFSPVQIKALVGQKITDIACGESYSACITSEDSVYIWGVSSHGRCGLTTDKNILIPVLIEEFKSVKVEQVFLGMTSSFAILKSHSVFCWGSGQHGKLGLELSQERIYSVPRAMNTLQHTQIQEFAAGPFHTLALSVDGDLYAFGNSKDGKLGLNLRYFGGNESHINVEVPRLLEGEQSLPKFFSKARPNQLNKTFTAYSAVMTLRHPRTSKKLVQVVCSDKNTYFLLSTGKMFVCGANDVGQCSMELEKTDSDSESEGDEVLKNIKKVLDWHDTDESDREEVRAFDIDVIPEEARELLKNLVGCQDVQQPKEIKFAHMKIQPVVKHISANGSFVLATTEKGVCFAWGDNEYGQLGLGLHVEFVASPTPVSRLASHPVVMTAAGQNHSLFLTQLGHVYSAGFNEFGQLGFPIYHIAKEKVFKTHFKEEFLKMNTVDVPKKIADLENVSFIAAGGQSSFAVKRFEDPQNPQRLYSWGWGASGQLGHSKVRHQFNLSRPKKVKFRGSNDVQVVQVSAACKHTLVLDTQNRLWFFGQKECIGLVVPDDRNQFEPALLLPKNDVNICQKQNKFEFVAAGDNKNVAVSMFDHEIFEFGREVSQELQLTTTQEAIFLQADKTQDTSLRSIFKPVTRIKSQFVSCGLEHTVALQEQDTSPFVWGFSRNGACGINLLKNIQVPTEIETFTKKFLSQQSEVQKVNSGTMSATTFSGVGDIPVILKQYVVATDKPLCFPIQAGLKSKNFEDEELIKEDLAIHSLFLKTCEELQAHLQTLTGAVNTQIVHSQDAIMARAYSFPTKVAELEQVNPVVPRDVLQKKPLFEKIFTILQLHPCYLLRWLKCNQEVSSSELVIILQAVFGTRELVDNDRVLKTLCVIAKHEFCFELSQSNVKDMTSEYKIKSAFRTIFNLVFDSQSQNRRFVNRVVTSLVHRVSLAPELKTSAEKTRFWLVRDTLSDILKLLDVDLTAEMNQKSKSTCVSREVITLLSFVQSELTAQDARQKSNFQTEIQSFTLSLLSQKLISTLKEITPAQIQFEFWDNQKFKEVPDLSLFENKDSSLLTLVASSLQLYLLTSAEETQTDPKMFQFIQHGFCRDEDGLQTPNYRRRILEHISNDESAYDLSLLQQMFLTSTELIRDPTLTISVFDVIMVLEKIRQDGDKVFGGNPKDILRKLFDKCPKSIELSSVKESSRRARLTMKISARVLVDERRFVKCGDCGAPLTQAMVEEKAFEESLQGPTADCKARNLPFRNFTPTAISDDARLFQAVLRDLPLLYKTKDVKGFFEKESHKIQDKVDRGHATQNDLQMKNNLEKLITSMENASQDLRVVNDNDVAALQNKMCESHFEFLSKLESILLNSFTAKVLHQSRQNTYKALLSEVATLKGASKQRAIVCCQNLAALKNNMYSGVSSSFLKPLLKESGRWIDAGAQNENKYKAPFQVVEKKDDVDLGDTVQAHVWAGKWHIVDIKQQRKHERLLEDIENSAAYQLKTGKPKSLIPRTEDEKVNKFFAEFETKYESESVQAVQDQSQFLAEIGLCRTYEQRYTLNYFKFSYLEKQGVVLNAVEGIDHQVLMNSQFSFQFSAHGGFQVDLTFKDPPSLLTQIFKLQHTNEVLLRRFEISQKDLLEMRRNYATSGVVTYKQVKFRVEKLVWLLNSVSFSRNVFEEAKTLWGISKLQLPRSSQKKHRNTNTDQQVESNSDDEKALTEQAAQEETKPRKAKSLKKSRKLK